MLEDFIDPLVIEEQLTHESETSQSHGAAGLGAGFTAQDALHIGDSDAVHDVKVVGRLGGPEGKQQEAVGLDFLGVLDLNGVKELLEHVEPAFIVDLKELVGEAVLAEEKQQLRGPVHDLESYFKLVTLDDELEELLLREELQEAVRIVGTNAVDALDRECFIFEILGLDAMDERTQYVQSRTHDLVLEGVPTQGGLAHIEQSAKKSEA